MTAAFVLCLMLLLAPATALNAQAAPTWAQIAFDPNSPTVGTPAEVSFSIPLVVGSTSASQISISFDQDEMFIDALVAGPPFGGNVGDEVVRYQKEFPAPAPGTYRIRVRFQNEFGPYIVFDGGQLLVREAGAANNPQTIPSSSRLALSCLILLSLFIGLGILRRRSS